MKPRFGSGSFAVRVVFSESEKQKHMEEYDKFSSYGELLAEEFIVGTEFGIDMVISENRVCFFNVRSKKMTALPFRQELAYISPAEISYNTHKNILNTMTAAIKGLRITDAMVHADVMIDKNGTVYIIEMSPRPAGLNVVTKILKYNTGRDLIRDFIVRQVYNKPFEDCKTQNIIGLSYFPFENVSITRTLNSDNLREKYNILEFINNMKKGDCLKNIKNGTDILERGYFIISDENYSSLTERLNSVIADLEKEVKGNGDAEQENMGGG